MNEYRLTLPWPPTNNMYYRHGRRGNYISENGKKYAVLVKNAIQNQDLALKLPQKLSVKIYASPPDNRIRDLDNVLKGLFDALTKAGFWLDDSQIDHLSISRITKRKGGGIRMQVRTLDDDSLLTWEDICSG